MDFSGFSLGVVWALVSVFENAAAFSKPERFHGAVLWFLDRPCSVKPFSWYGYRMDYGTRRDELQNRKTVMWTNLVALDHYGSARAFPSSSPRLQSSPLSKMERWAPEDQRGGMLLKMLGRSWGPFPALRG